MFAVKRLDTGKIYDVLDTYFVPEQQYTYFLIWEGRWCWRPAHKYELYTPLKEKSLEEMINMAR